MKFNITPGGVLQGVIRVAGDKSISHRSIMLGSLADGETRVSGFLQAEDAMATLEAFKGMGVKIEGPHRGEVLIHGVGLHGLQAPKEPIYLGNSGTSMRLLCGLLAAQSFDSILTGDESLTRRPMKRVTEPLALMGAEIETSEEGTAPLKIHGGRPLKAIEYYMSVASAQVKSCLMLAGMYAQGQMRVHEPAPTRDHTERMLEGLGYPIERFPGGVALTGNHSLKATYIDVPSDISSAAFFMVGASIVPGSDILLQNVGINPTRTGVIDILRLMGADISLQNNRLSGGEPVADIRVRAAPLSGVTIPEELVPLAIDEFPAIFIAASCAKGETVLTGAAELRVKESDRIQSMAEGLVALGIEAKPTDDGMVIQGGTISGGQVNAHGDHRIAMSFAIAGMVAEGLVTIRDCANVNTSFPGFVSIASEAGMRVVAEQDAGAANG